MFKFPRMITTSIFTTLLLFPSIIKAEEHPLVGISYPPLPEEVNDKGGWIIDETYSVNQVSTKGRELLFLDRLIRRDSKGKGYFQVIDVLTLPTMTETEEISGGDCFVNGQNERNFIAIMKSNDNTPFLTKVLKAWRVEGEKFNEVDVTRLRVKCENYSYGL